MIGMELPESERLYEILLVQINRLNEMIALNQEPSDEFLESVMAFEEVINQMTVKAATLTSEERETASANSVSNIDNGAQAVCSQVRIVVFDDVSGGRSGPDWSRRFRGCLFLHSSLARYWRN